METKSTNEVKGDYDRVSASECLGSLIELHGIVMEDDLVAQLPVRVAPECTPVSYTHLDVYKRQS